MTLPVRRRLRGLLVLPVVVALTLVAPPTSALAASGNAPNSERQVTVMTRNLYLGADLTGLLAATPQTLPSAIGHILGTVEQSAPAQRMAGIAAEIAANDPDLVALQEVATWHINAVPGVLPAADYDFLALLRQRLAALGEPYDVVVSQPNFDSTQQLPALTAATFVDSDVILVRHDTPVSQVKVLAVGRDHYAAQLLIPVQSLGVSINFDRGYEWADVKTRGKVWRIVNTHPEAYAPGDLFPGATGDVNGAQAQELVAALAGVTTPTVLLGDLNSARNETKRAAYTAFTNAGFSDTWLALGLSDTAYTCCYDELLSSGALYERIDHVLVRGDVTPSSASHVGVAPFRTSPPLWPSDHAGVVTAVSIGKQ